MEVATRRRSRAVLLLAVLGLLQGTAFADMPEAINRARAEGCGVKRPALRENAHLTATARLLSQGVRLADAQHRAGYHAAHIVSLQVPGADDDRSLTQTLTQQLCARLATPGILEFGAYRSGADVWIALGEPFIPPDPQQAAAISRRVLELTNAARAAARRCGDEDFPAAGPVALDPQLEQAAAAHSQDMAVHGYLSHKGTDGTSPAERITRTGYGWRLFGENVASGDATAESVMAGWLASPEHCRNIMTAGFRQMGLAFAVNLDSDGRVYWTQELAARPSAD